MIENETLPTLRKQYSAVGTELATYTDMPLYEYECWHCKTRFETLISLSKPQTIDWGKVEPEWARCPHCTCPAPKIPSVSTLQFKGAGWTPKFHTDK